MSFSQCRRTSLWPPCIAGCGHIYIFILWFLLSFFFLFLFPCLISAVGHWMSTILPHMVWPYCEFRMHVWNVLHTARWKYRTQKWRKKSPSGHHCTTLSGYIFATKACIDSRKKYLLNSNISPTKLWPTSGWDHFVSLGHPSKFQRLSSWQHYCTVLQYWASAKLCGVEQRATPIFGRAAIMLGIGPHSSFYLICIRFFSISWLLLYF